MFSGERGANKLRAAFRNANCVGKALLVDGIGLFNLELEHQINYVLTDNDWGIKPLIPFYSIRQTSPRSKTLSIDA